MEYNIKMDFKVIERLRLDSSRENSVTLKSWQLGGYLSHCQWRWSSFTVSFMLCYSCWDGTSWLWIDGLHQQQIQTWSSPPRGPRDSSLSGLHNHTHTRIPLDEWSALRKHLYLTTYNTHRRQVSMLPAGFEPAIPATERPQTHALDRTAKVAVLRHSDFNHSWCWHTKGCDT